MNRIVLIFGGQGAAAILIMARNLCLARLVGLEAYGEAMALVMALAIIELVTNLGLPQQIVSRSDGARRQVQACLHAAQLARGCIGSLALLIVAHPLAAFLGSPDLGWALTISALVPLCLGFMHLDAFRAQRYRRHGPQIALLVGPSLVSLALLWPASFWVEGSVLMLSLIGAQALSSTLLSHALARRRYQLRFSHKQTLLLLNFGIPLVGNGVLLCAVLHVEKLIAGHHFGLSALAVYAMGAALTMTPALTAGRSFQAYHLPILRRAAQRPEIANVVLRRGFLIGGGLAVVLGALAPFVLDFLGEAFAPVGPLLPAFIVLACLRLPKSAVATFALSVGRTHIPMLANIPRIIALPIVWLVAQSGAGLMEMLSIALIAEVSGLILGLIASRRDVKMPWTEMFAFGLVCFLTLADQIQLGIAVLALVIARAGLGRVSLGTRAAA